MAELLGLMQEIDTEEEMGIISESDIILCQNFKEEYLCKVKEEEIKWRQRSGLTWLKEGDRSTKNFHKFASFRSRKDNFFLLDGTRRLESKEDISEHVVAFFKDFFSKEEWERPVLDNVDFPFIDLAVADDLEKEFEEQEVKAWKGQSSGPDGFPLAFFQVFWEEIKTDYEFHE